MNTDSHYRKEIIEKLLRNKKNNASKSLKSDKSIRTYKKIPLYQFKIK